MHIIEYLDVLNNIEEQTARLNENKQQGFNQEQLNLISKNIFPVKNLNEINLNHFNPTHYKHSCPSTNGEDNYHFGDLGNIIANNEGKAFISIVKKISLKSITGRLIIISNSPDKCQENTDKDKLADVIALGQLGVYKPDIVEKTNGSQEFFLREVNTVNKKEFDKNYNIQDNNKKSRKILNNKRKIEQPKEKTDKELKTIKDLISSNHANKLNSAAINNKNLTSLNKNSNNEYNDKIISDKQDKKEKDKNSILLEKPKVGNNIGVDDIKDAKGIAIPSKL